MSDNKNILILDGLTPDHGNMLLGAVRIHARIADGDLFSIMQHPEIELRLNEASDAGEDSFTYFKEHLQFLQGFVFMDKSSLTSKIVENANRLLDLIETWDGAGRGKLCVPLEGGMAGEFVALLDLHCRIGIGQFRIEEHPTVQDQVSASWEAGRGSSFLDTIQGVMLRARLIVMPALTGGLGHSYGIHSRAIQDEARLSYDVMQVARHALSWHRHHEQGGTGGTWQVNFDTPRASSRQPLPQAEIVRAEPEASPTP